MPVSVARKSKEPDAAGGGRAARQPERAASPDLAISAATPVAALTGLSVPRRVALLQRSVGNRAVARRLAAEGHVIQLGVANLLPGPARAGAGAEPAIQRAAVTLTQAKKYATKGFLTWFQDQVKAIAEGWGLAFDPAAVTLTTIGTGKKAKSAVVLAWDKAWGDAPKAAEVNFDMEPIKARMAVAGVQQLKGWARIGKKDQSILDALLGGETNDLSKAARKHLAATFADLKTKSAKAQCAALRGTMTATTAQPDVVAETVSTAKVGYKLEGPKTQKNYEFHGAKGTAQIWKIKFVDGVEIELVAPKAPKKGFHNHTVKQTAESASYVAKAARSVVKTILLNANTNPDDAHWAVEYKTPDFHSYMTAGVAGIVTIYPNKKSKPLPSMDYMRGTLVHESGHTWSYKTWGTDKTKGKWVDWKKAMAKDKLSVSDYATKSISEDVAETIQVYVTTQGSKRFEEYKSMVPARFKILENDYK